MLLNVYKEINSQVLSKLSRKGRVPADSQKDVKSMLIDIAERGEAAIIALRERFDSFSGPIEKLGTASLEAQASLCPEAVRVAIESSILRIRAFHKAQQISVPSIETAPGVRCWRKSLPIEAVGLYVPGGSAPLFSSLIMLAVPAQLSGCSRIVICTPPTRDGKIHSSIAAVAQILELTEIYLIGGVQAIGLMAYGTEAIEPVSKIFGPGNSYVTSAKQIVASQGVAIDMPAGPSEVLVIADGQANARFVAADLLSQCEHGPDSQAVLLTDSLDLIDSVQQQIDIQGKRLARTEQIQASLANSFVVLVPDLETALKLSNSYAPEHLILAVESPHELAEKVVNAGSVFLGNYSAEVFGDYCSGPNHTLPTAGNAKAYSGISCDSFSKLVTFQEVSQSGAELLAPTAALLAQAEGLDAHVMAANFRVGKV